MTNAQQARPDRYITLDRKRKCVLNLAALCALEEKLGQSAFRAINWGELGVRDLRLILWASLLTDDPELTLEHLDEIVPVGRFLRLQSFIMHDIIETAFPESSGEEVDEEDEKKEAAETSIG